MSIRLYSILLCALSVTSLIGCGEKDVTMLVPEKEVTIYADVEGVRKLGTETRPMPVTRLHFPDKTDYVVEVYWHGRSGYVKEGPYHLERRGARPVVP